MSCIFCGNEFAPFEVPGIEGTACKECNRHLNALHDGAVAETKSYFEIVTGNSIKPDAKNYLQKEFEKYKADIEIKFSTGNSKPDERDKNPEATLKHTRPTEPEAIRPNSDYVKIEKLLQEQNTHLQTIKYILIFFAVIVGIGLIISIVGAVQSVQTAKALTEAFKL